MSKDCFNFSCPAYEAQCPCVACPNRTLSEFTNTSNRTLTDREISAILAKMQNEDKDYAECKGAWLDWLRQEATQ